MTPSALTLGGVGQVGIRLLGDIGVVVGRRLGHVLGLWVVLGQRRTRDGRPGKRSRTVSRGRLTDRLILLDL